MTEAEQEVLNISEAAAFLRVDRKTLTKHVYRNAVPYRRIGRRILFSRRALMNWLARVDAA